MKFLILLFLPMSVFSKTIMIIDTPVNEQHKEFVKENIKQLDNDFKAVEPAYKHHGANILSLIIAGKNQKDALKTKHNYFICTSYTDLNLACYRLALLLNVDVINYSGGGSLESKEEYALVKKLNDKGVKMFFAAGNEGVDINKEPYYPAYYAKTLKNVVAISNKKPNGELVESSNYSSFTKPYEGYQMIGAGLDGYVTMTGTSQATAMATHEYLKGLEK